MKTTRKLIAMLLAVLMCFSLAACGNEAAETKDSVVIAIGSEPETLDPTQGWGHGNAPIVQSTLVRYTSDLSFENDLATGYELSPDGLTWTFTIRDDVKFTDGEKLTASDVAFTLETAKAAQGAVDLTYMESAVAQDDKTVVITLSKPTSIFLNTLASVGIVPEHAYGDDYGMNPIGSGPYKFVEWKAQEQIIFTANEDYYDGVPAIKNVTVVFMSEDAALAAVQAGQVDVAYSTATLGTTEVEGYHVEAITSADNRGFTLPVLPAEGKTTESGAPIGNDVTCNIEIRQAIAYAIDRQLIADVVLNGFGRPAYSENDGMPWNNPEVKIVMFSEAVLMGWGSAIPNETYYLYRSEGALLDDFYNPEGYMSEVTDGYLNAAMEALTVEKANENWQKAQWDGTTGTAMQGECPWVWIVNLDHVTYVRDGLSIGDQPIHGHGHGLPLIQNLQDWAWEK